MLALLLVLACGGGEEPDPVGRPDWAAPVLHLSDEVLSRVTDLRSLGQGASANDAASCALLADATELSDVLNAHFDTLAASRVLAVGTPFSDALEDLNAALVGVQLVATPVGVRVSPDFNGIAVAAGKQPNGMHRMGGLVDMGWFLGARSVWLDPSGCARIERAVAGLGRLETASQQVPQCARDLLEPRLRLELDRMTGWTCHCTERGAALNAAEQASRSLKKLGALGGQMRATSLLSSVNSREARFGGRCD
jgi:hypothetical protein